MSTTSTRALCAGADVAEALDHAGGVARMEAFARLYAAVEAFPAATVCVCVGNVVGAGAEIAAGCDLRVGGDNLRLAWAGARVGAPVGPARLTPLVGLAAAKDLVLTGRTVGWTRRWRSGSCSAPRRRARPSARRSSWPPRSPRTRPRACARSSSCSAATRTCRRASTTRTSGSSPSSATARDCRGASPRRRRPRPRAPANLDRPHQWPHGHRAERRTCPPRPRRRRCSRGRRRPAGPPGSAAAAGVGGDGAREDRAQQRGADRPADLLHGVDHRRGDARVAPVDAVGRRRERGGEDVAHARSP